MILNTFKKHLIKKGSTIREALERLNFLALDAIVFVVDDSGRLTGSLTDGDVRRGLLKGNTINDPVEDIIQPHPKYLRKGEYDIEKVIYFRDNNFRIIPIVNHNEQIVNVINFRELKSYLPVDAVIMAGGKGERLKPLTDEMPKPLLKVGDKTIIEHNLGRLALYGIDDFWVALRHLGKQIEDHLGNGYDRNFSIKYVHEEEPLGTIGAVSLIDGFVHNSVLVTNSDILTNIDYEHFFIDFLRQDADFSVVTIPYSVDIPYAVLETNNGHVLNFREKPTYTYYSNGGIYLMKREVLSFIPAHTHYHATQLMEDLLKSGKKVVSYPLSGYWLDIGRHEDYFKAQKDIQTINFK